MPKLFEQPERQIVAATDGLAQVPDFRAIAFILDDGGLLAAPIIFVV